MSRQTEKKLRFLLLSILLLAACRHKQAQPQMVYVDSATRQHFLFKPGSYWIYKDLVSGRVDSCYVERLDSSMISFDNDRKIGQMIQSNMLQYATSNISDSIIYRWHIKKGLLQIYYTLPNNFMMFGSGIVLSYPFHIGEILGDDSGYVSAITPLYSLKGNNYRDALQGYLRFNHESDQYTQFVINDSVGFIKISTNYKKTNYVWELEKCNIVK